MPTVGSVIAGATSAEQVVQNAAGGMWVPSGDDLEALLEITEAAV
jgi:aryl-alcohol dehydrogenase-like predicted oxidoreductase